MYDISPKIASIHVAIFYQCKRTRGLFLSALPLLLGLLGGQPYENGIPRLDIEDTGILYDLVKLPHRASKNINKYSI